MYKQEYLHRDKTHTIHLQYQDSLSLHSFIN